MEEVAYELFRSLNFDRYVAFIYGLESLDHKLLYKAQKTLIEDGYVITKVEAPYIQCLKINAKENRN